MFMRVLVPAYVGCSGQRAIKMVIVFLVVCLQCVWNLYWQKLAAADGTADSRRPATPNRCACVYVPQIYVVCTVDWMPENCFLCIWCSFSPRNSCCVTYVILFLRWTPLVAVIVGAATVWYLGAFCRVTTCLESLDVSGNLTAVREMSGILLKVREVSGKKSCQGKVA